MSPRTLPSPSSSRVKHIRSFFRTTKFRTILRFSIVEGLIISAIMLWGHLDANAMSLNGHFHVGLVVVLSILMVLIVHLIYAFVISHVRRRWVRILIMTLATIVVASFFTHLTIGLTHLIYNHYATEVSYSLRELFDSLMMLILAMLSSFIFSIKRRHQLEINIEQLRSANTLMGYEALQAQLDPHFLFNSLTMLDNLIGLDDARAKEYLQQLVLIYRHTAGGPMPTTLQEEMKFVEAYLYVMEMRLGGSLTVETTIDESLLTDYVMHFGIQLLIENAIKHNVINEQHPMTIHITSTPEGTIEVRNPIRPKKNPEPSNLHIGLSNLDKSYSMLFGCSIVITRTAEEFSVAIPVIPRQKALDVIQELEKNVSVNDDRLFFDDELFQRIKDTVVLDQPDTPRRFRKIRKRYKTRKS